MRGRSRRWRAGGKKDRLTFVGGEISSADIGVAGRKSVRIKIVLDEDSNLKEWKASLERGVRWARFKEFSRPYEAIDVGEENQP